MSQYQLRSGDDVVIAEQSFDSFDAANAWAIEQSADDGWILYQRIGGDWTPARLDPS